MIKSKTVFVIGAGASKEADFPLGSELKHIISSKLNFKANTSGRNTGDGAIYDALQYHHRDKLKDHLLACRQISEGIIHSDSIDDFIDFHQNEFIGFCGKMAIASSILEAEKKSKLYVKPDNFYNTINFSSVANTWYPKLYSLLIKQLRKSEIENIFDNVSFVNFNYDRSIEHYLVHALSKHTQVDVNSASLIVKNLKIYRPYGSVGSYFTPNAIQYGNTDSINISNLKTYTEQIEDKSMLEEVRKEMQQAEAVVFLGMAYHPNNMKLLESDANNVYGMFGKKIYATSCGFTDSDLEVICRDIGKLQPSKVARVSQPIPDNMKFASTCQELFDMYKKSLSEL